MFCRSVAAASSVIVPGKNALQLGEQLANGPGLAAEQGGVRLTPCNVVAALGFSIEQQGDLIGSAQGDTDAMGGVHCPYPILTHAQPK